MSEQYAIEMRGITKAFGSVVANDKINLQVKSGEILALLGENGSGKTTLMNMLSGIYKPDSGSILIDGKEVSIDSPEDAKRLGIGMVHQHFKLVDVFSAADNIWMGREKAGFALRKERYEQIGQIAQKFGFDLDPKKRFTIWRCPKSKPWRSLRFFITVPRLSFLMSLPRCLPSRRSGSFLMCCGGCGKRGMPLSSLPTSWAR